MFILNIPTYVFVSQTDHPQQTDPRTAVISKGLSTGRKTDTDNIPTNKAYNY